MRLEPSPQRLTLENLESRLNLSLAGMAERAERTGPPAATPDQSDTAGNAPTGCVDDTHGLTYAIYVVSGNDSHSHSHSNAHADTNSYAHADANTQRRQRYHTQYDIVYRIVY